MTRVLWDSWKKSLHLLVLVMSWKSQLWLLNTKANEFIAATLGWGGGKGCCWVDRGRTEDAGALLSESCLVPWKPVIHKPNYVQVECQLWQNETNARFVWLGFFFFFFLMKSCFTSRFYLHKCLFKKEENQNQIIYFPTHSWKALISVWKARALGCCVHFAKRERKTWESREILLALPVTLCAFLSI